LQGLQPSLAPETAMIQGHKQNPAPRREPRETPEAFESSIQGFRLSFPLIVLSSQPLSVISLFLRVPVLALLISDVRDAKVCRATNLTVTYHTYMLSPHLSSVLDIYGENPVAPLARERGSRPFLFCESSLINPRAGTGLFLCDGQVAEALRAALLTTALPRNGPHAASSLPACPGPALSACFVLHSGLATWGSR
jgi:hypothetical protein